MDIDKLFSILIVLLTISNVLSWLKIYNLEDLIYELEVDIFNCQTEIENKRR